MAPKARRYRFHVVDMDERREYAERVASGALSVETYKERLASQRGPSTKPSERRRVRDFNKAWKRKRKGYVCAFPGCTSRALYPKPNTICYLHADPEREARLNEYRKQSLAPIETAKRRQRRGELEETNAIMV